MIRIITDSAADMNLEELRSLRVDRISMPISLGNQSIENGDSLPLEEFWKRMEAGEISRTSQPSPDAFANYFQEATTAGDSVVYISLSSALSGTYQSAVIGCDLVEGGDIHIVDSLSATVGQKILIMHACRLRDEGKLSATEIAEEITNLRGRLRLYACLDTLDYLARGGRIPKAAASLGGLVRLKAIITLTPDGHVGMAGKSLGIGRSYAQVLGTVDQHEIDPEFPIIPIYSMLPNNCHSFMQKFSAHYPSLTCTAPMPIGTTIGTHIGPNAYGIVFVAKA